MTITIIDYEMGNLGSIENMCKKLGIAAEVSNRPKTIAAADKLILPGVGAFDPGMSKLRRLGLIDVLTEKVLMQGTPVLGICLGMQLMTKSSEEGCEPGLAWIDATVVGFDNTAEPRKKIPHMGWNLVHAAKESTLLADIGSEARFYFVHSYYVRCARHEDVLLYADYIDRFDAAFQRGNIVGVQFHPEKSHKFGMTLLKNFAVMA